MGRLVIAVFWVAKEKKIADSAILLLYAGDKEQKREQVLFSSLHVTF